MEYKGLYDEQEKNKEQRYFEFGAHFRYIELVKALKVIQKTQNIKKEKANNINNSNIISNDQNYNEVYNQINKQLCQKMTDLMPKNKFIQSRNIKPLIQSLSQKLTDIVQSQSNKKPMKHNVTKKRYINSNMSTKQKMKNNNCNKNSDIKKNNLNSIIRNIEPNYICRNQLYKQPETSQSRNYLKNKKSTSKKNIKNVQLSHNKKNNVISHEIKNYTNLQNRPQNLAKMAKITNYNKANEIMYGTIIEKNKNNNSSNNNNQNTKTVQNIIVKPNINISFINNFNTTFLHKSKKRTKKIRSRNNQQLTKQNIMGNKFNLNEDDAEDSNNKIYKNNEDNHLENNANNIEIILLKKNNENINIKEFNKKRTLISPKMKNIKNKDIHGNVKKNNSNNKNLIANDNILKNLIDKAPHQKFENKGKNNNGNNKPNKTAFEINNNNILNNDFNNFKLKNNYMPNNFNSNINRKLNNNSNINNNNNQILKCVGQLNNKQKNSVLIRNKAVLANNISENKRCQNIMGKFNTNM